MGRGLILGSGTACYLSARTRSKPKLARGRGGHPPVYVPHDWLTSPAIRASFSAAISRTPYPIPTRQTRTDHESSGMTPRKITELPDVSDRPLQAPMGWTIHDSEWQVERVDKQGDVVEKLAYCMSFACADAAYEAAIKAMPYEHITFRHRARLIREHVGKWTANPR